MSRMPEPLPLDSLFASDGVTFNTQCPLWSAIHTADIVVARDVMTGGHVLAYGRDALERAAEAEGVSHVEVVRVDMDFDDKSNDMSRLCALLLIVKGRHDYGVGDTVEKFLQCNGLSQP